MATRDLQHFAHARDHALAVVNLAEDPLLHVVDDERESIGPTHIAERIGDL
jgi:hypothetical protein